MKTWDALKTCINGHVSAVAKATRKNTVTVYKWTEPHDDFSDSGNHNPLDTLEEIILAAVADGQQEKAALEPLYYLAHRFNCICLKIPKTPHTLEALNTELMRTIREFGRLINAAGKALEDGHISRNELQIIEKNGMEVIRQIICFLKKADEETK